MQTIDNFQEFCKGKTDIQVQFKERLYKVDANGEPRQLLRKNRWGYYAPERKSEMRKADVPEFLTMVRQAEAEKQIDQVLTEAESLKALQSSSGEDQDTSAIGNRISGLTRRAAFLKAMSPANGRPIK